MLLSDINRFSIIIQVIQTKLLRDKVYPLSKWKLVDDPLKLLKKIDVTWLNLGRNDPKSEGIYHL